MAVQNIFSEEVWSRRISHFTKFFIIQMIKEGQICIVLTKSFPEETYFIKFELQMTKLQHFEVLELEKSSIRSQHGLVGSLLEMPTTNPQH